ncbi:MAG: DUF4349 domain-containing protein [Myxococcota bacterium]
MAPAFGGMAEPAMVDQPQMSRMAQADDAMGAASGEATPPGQRVAPPTAVDAPPRPGPPTASAKPKPLLIYRATVVMAVFETLQSIDSIQAMADELDGYLVRRTNDFIEIRIPSERYRDALGRIGKLGDVVDRTETVEDVTEQFMDMLIRLKNKRAVRERLQQLLAQANDVKAALAVEKELARLTEDIERIEGKLKRLRELIAFSTITVRFQARPTERLRSNVRLPVPWLDELGLSNLLNL